MIVKIGISSSGVGSTWHQTTIFLIKTMVYIITFIIIYRKNVLHISLCVRETWSIYIQTHIYTCRGKIPYKLDMNWEIKKKSVQCQCQIAGWWLAGWHTVYVYVIWYIVKHFIHVSSYKIHHHMFAKWRYCGYYLYHIAFSILECSSLLLLLVRFIYVYYFILSTFRQVLLASN